MAKRSSLTRALQRRAAEAEASRRRSQQQWELAAAAREPKPASPDQYRRVMAACQAAAERAAQHGDLNWATLVKGIPRAGLGRLLGRADVAGWLVYCEDTGSDVRCGGPKLDENVEYGRMSGVFVLEDGRLAVDTAETGRYSMFRPPQEITYAQLYKPSDHVRALGNSSYRLVLPSPESLLSIIEQSFNGRG